MGRDVAERFSVAADTFHLADEILGFELSKFCYEGPAERLNATDIQQPAIFATSVAIFRAAVDCGFFQSGQFAAMGGLSLGEYTALHLAEAVGFEDALRLVQRRGRLMQEAATQQQGGMVSIMGLDEEQVLALCEKLAPHGRLGPANFNCPGQIVVSGDVAACRAALEEIESSGGRGVALNVAGAFHSELMRPAAEALREALNETEFTPPTLRVIANVDAEYHSQPAAMRESLVRQVINPVRWEACVRRLIADGCARFWEVGPNRVLTGLMRKIDRSIKTINVSKVSSLESSGVLGGGS